MRHIYTFLSLDRVTVFGICLCVSLLAPIQTTLASRAGCSYALGMADGRIRNTQLSAESSDSGWGPSRGRLNDNAAWCSDSEEKWTTFFQIRLDRVRHVSGIGTQGQTYLTISYYVTSYAIKYSFNGVDWYWYTDTGSSDTKVFPANRDTSTEKRNIFRDTFVTLYLRIYPIEFNKDMCLRVEVYGCTDSKDCTQVAKQSTGDIFSPSYPQYYPQGIDCTWIVTLLSKSKRAALLFKDFDVQEGQTWGCNRDVVDVLDGPLDSSSSIGHFCNGQPLTVAKTTRDVLRVQFHSERDSKPRKGFLAHFISYTPGVDDVRVAVACKGTMLTLNCTSTPYSIQILHIRYGAFPYSPACGSTGTNVTCQATEVTTLVTSRCQHYRACAVTADGPKYDLSCGTGAKPRLDVYYQCIGSIFKSTSPPTAVTTTALKSTTHPPTNLSTPITDTTAEPHATPPPTVPIRTPPATDLVTPEGYSSTPTGPGGTGGKQARTEGGGGSGLVIGLAVAISCVAVVLVAILLFFFCRRRRKYKGTPIPDVTYAATEPPEEPHASERGGRSSNNEYESINVLYDSPQETSLKLTDNPLYEKSGPVHGYESVGPSSAMLSSPAASSPIYDSPLDVKRIPTSVANPNYGKSVIEIPLA